MSTVVTTTAIFGLITIFWGGVLGAGIAACFDGTGFVGARGPARQA